MIRRSIKTGLIALLSVGTFGLNTAELPAQPAEKLTPGTYVTENLPSIPGYRETVDFAAVHYSADLTEREVLDRVHADAEKLGIPLVRTFVTGKVAVFGASQGETRKALRAVEELPVVAVSPVYAANGTYHPERMMVFTSRLLLTFRSSVSESEKESFYRINGFTRIKEHASGRVMVDTHRQPGPQMMSFARQLASESFLVDEAQYDLLLPAKTKLNSNSITINDDFFDLQWYLDNTFENTFGQADADIDAPRGWQVNRLFGATQYFGSPDVVVGVFDTGVELDHEDLGENIDPRVGIDRVDGGLPIAVNDFVGNHGIAMAGVVAADNNFWGITGVAPDLSVYISRVLGPDHVADMYDPHVYRPDLDQTDDDTGLGQDLSLSSAAIQSAIEDSIFKGIDVNLHAYTISVGTLDTSIVGNIETALRQSFESGRTRFGTTNVAAAGNEYSQVGYPASSVWTIAVGGVDSNDSWVPQSNWGGTGVDIVMPGTATGRVTRNILDQLLFDFFYSGQGLISTDLTGEQGLARRDVFTPGNEDGDYGATNLLTGFTQVSRTAPDEAGIDLLNQQFLRLYGGTSYSAAMAAATVGMMLSDARFTTLPPFAAPPQVLLSDITRDQYRLRAPLRPNDDNLLSQMIQYADLPAPGWPNPGSFNLEYDERAVQLSYLNNQFNQYTGHGRPNLGRILALNNSINPGSSSLYTPDSLFERFIRYDVPIVEFVFDKVGDFGIITDEDGEEVDPVWDELTQGWRADPLNRLRLNTGEPDLEITVSPFLDAVRLLYFEDGTVKIPEVDGLPAPNQFFYVWTDSLTTAPEGSENVDSVTNLIFNPDGQYPSQVTQRLISPEIPFETTDTLEQNIPPTVPTVAEFQIAHALGVQDTSTFPRRFAPDFGDDGNNLNSNTVGDPVYSEFEPDQLRILWRPVIPGLRQAASWEEVGILTGNSNAVPKAPLEQPTIIQISDNPSVDRLRVAWRGGPTNVYYNPLLPESDMVIRTYRFLCPPLPEGATSMQFAIELVPGDSVLPVWFFNDTDFVWEQVYDAPRDDLGFIFYSLKVYPTDPDYIERIDKSEHVLGDGSLITWTASTNDILGSKNTTGPDFFSAYSPVPEYLVEPFEPTGGEFGTLPREQIPLFRSEDQFTGINAHPFYEQVAITAADAEGGGVYLVSTDGINVRRLVDASLSQGARDPSWAANGSQLIFAGPNYIRIANILSDDSIEVETVIEDHSFLTDFRSPVFDPSAGLIYFSARRSADADSKLNVYVAGRNGRVLGYRFDSENLPLPLLAGWENSDVFDLDMSANGQTMAFVANADAPPEFNGNVVSFQAPTSDTTTAYAITNLQYVMLYNDPPSYVELPLLDPSTGEPRDSVRWPRMIPNEFRPTQIAWVGYDGPMTADGDPGDGKIYSQLMPAYFAGSPVNVPEPVRPDPTVPPPTPEPPDNARIVKEGEFNFAGNSNGWEFNTGGFTQNPLLARYEQISEDPREIEEGLIAFFASNSSIVEIPNTRVANLSFVATGTGTVDFSFRNSELRITRAQTYLREDLPTTYQSESGTKLAGARQDLPARIFTSPESVTFEDGDQVNITVRIDPNNQPVRFLEVYLEFDPDLLAFDSGSVNLNAFDSGFSQGTITLRSNDSNDVFGYYESAESAMQVRENSLYLVRSQVSATAGTPDELVPTLRMRVNSTNLESVFTVETDSFGDQVLSPNSETIKAVDLLFRPPDGIFDLPTEDRTYRMSFDLLNFLPDSIDPNGGITLHEVELFRLDNNQKHVALWGFNNPAGGNPISFNVVGTNGVDGELTLELRSCCYEANASSSRCATGSALNGVSLSSSGLPAGDYTLVAVADRAQDLILTWDSVVPLEDSTSVDGCATESRQINDAVSFCTQRTLISGNGSDPANPEVRLPSVVPTLYDGSAVFDMPHCIPTPNESVIKNTRLIYTADMSLPAVRDTWVTGPDGNPFNDPDFLENSDSLALSVLNRASTFGFWNVDDIAIPPAALEINEDSPVAIFRGTFSLFTEATADSGLGLLDPLDLPDIRVRMATNEFQRSVSGLLISLNDGATVPQPGTPRELEIYMVLEEVPTTLESLVAAFDVLSFYPEEVFPNREVTEEPIQLELLRIERVDIPGYPAPR